jgi:hypothetical protein
MIIAAYAGTGKTTFANLNPQTVVDFVCMPYKYLLSEDCEANEACKADPNNVMQDHWPFNYVSAIKSAYGDGKTLLIPTDSFVLMLLAEEELPYTLCYPQREAKEAYRKRYLGRGNTERFIKIFIGGWDERMERIEQDPYGRHIVMQPHQFLSDVIDLGAMHGQV